jgi:signal peptidase I
VSDDFFDPRRREVGDEDEGEEPRESDLGWDAPSSWPGADQTRRESGWQESDPGQPLREWERGYRPTSELSEETRHPSFQPRRSRDPLARLFPGLPRGLRVTLDWILTIAGAILIVLALKQWVVNPYRIPSSSMEPTLNCAKPALGCLGDSSDRVLACRICLDFGPPSRGDIVVFNTPSEAAARCGEGGTFVKRVIGLPGETVKEDRHGSIWIRGPDSKTFERLDEPYISAERRRLDSAHYRQTWTVPKGQYFMMGDNRGQSCDSRTWGSVPRDKLIGTVFFVYWPPDRIGFR